MLQSHIYQKRAVREEPPCRHLHPEGAHTSGRGRAGQRGGADSEAAGCHTYTPSGFKLDTRGFCRLRGWPRNCLAVGRGGESVAKQNVAGKISTKCDEKGINDGCIFIFGPFKNSHWEYIENTVQHVCRPYHCWCVCPAVLASGPVVPVVRWDVCGIEGLRPAG